MRRCPGRWCRGGAIGLSLLLHPAEAALSVASGYEEFLTAIRRRIICDQDDAYDEAMERGIALACDSLEDGPFCRGLPTLPRAPRHRPFTVDSIVPKQIFGNYGQATFKTVAFTLNHFLDDYFPAQAATSGQKVGAIEGRFAFEALAIGRGAPIPTHFSRGLPRGVNAAFYGAWEEFAIPHRIDGQRRSVAIRLNSASGLITFSRPVVIRRLVVHPPIGADESGQRHQLRIRTWKEGTDQEIWRTEYDFDAKSVESGALITRPSCGLGDLVSGKSPGDRGFDSVISEAGEDFAMVRWLDGDMSFRHVQWNALKLSSGTSCGLRNGSRSYFQVRRKDQEEGLDDPLDFWRDLSRHMQSVTQVHFLVPRGAQGWLLSDVVVVAPPLPQLQNEDPLKDKNALDPSGFMVQVFPGPTTAVAQISEAAVFYDADDMLERGLQLHSRSTSIKPSVSTRSRQSAQMAGGVGNQVVDVASLDATEGSQRLRVSMRHSVEAFQQFLRSLIGSSGLPQVRLPPHISLREVALAAEELIGSLERITPKDVKYYGHFEQLFSAHYEEKLSGLDSLQIAFERWSMDSHMQARSKGVFSAEQVWKGLYHCTQGPSLLELKITNVKREGEIERIEADLQFRVVGLTSNRDDERTDEAEETTAEASGQSTEAETQTTSGGYRLAGRIDPELRALLLEPIPGSWKEKPTNFVMVGLHGIVTSHGNADGSHRFAGLVPIFGCDSFELMLHEPVTTQASSHGLKSLESRDQLEQHSAASPMNEVPTFEELRELEALSLRAMLVRISRDLDDIRASWRHNLQSILNEKSSEGNTVQQTLSFGGQTFTMQQLMEVARPLAEGMGIVGTIIMKLGDHEVQVET